MYWSKYFLPTLKEIPMGTEAVSHQLSLRAGLVHMLTSGVYSYLPLGWRVLHKIENIIREEMDAIGCHELLMPALQPLDIWKKTGRDVTLKEVMISFDDKKGRRMCLGPTHEEIITTIAKDFVQSYRQLPVTLYQIQTKFRDELRTRYGIVRACEFIMKDAYSFDKVAGDRCDDFFMGGPQAHAMPFFIVKGDHHFFEGLVMAGFLPHLNGMQRRHQQFMATNCLHLFSNNSLYL